MWEMVELLSGELHLVPSHDKFPKFPRHDHSRECWCRPWQDDGVWVHQDDGANRKPAGASLLAGGAGIPGDAA